MLDRLELRVGLRGLDAEPAASDGSWDRTGTDKPADGAFGRIDRVLFLFGLWDVALG